jgi:hypothetical protein
MYKSSARSPEQDALQPLFLLATGSALLGAPSHIHPIWRDIPQHNTMDPSPQPSETDPLLPVDPPVKKPFYRPRPLWHVLFSISHSASFELAPRIVPFALTSALVVHNRGPIGFHWI